MSVRRNKIEVLSVARTKLPKTTVFVSRTLSKHPHTTALQMTDSKARKTGGAGAGTKAVTNMLDPLSAALEGSDPLSQLALAAAASSTSTAPVTDPLSTSQLPPALGAELLDPLSRMSVSKVKRHFKFPLRKAIFGAHRPPNDSRWGTTFSC